PWGDVTQSLIYHQCRKFMLRLDLRKDHVKFWRPQILLLVHNPRSSLHLVRFCNALKKGGLYVIGHVIKGDFREMMWEFRRQETAWLRLIDVLGVKAFLNIAVDKCDAAGARSIVFGAGLGGMRPNIVVMGFYSLGTDRAEPVAAVADGLPALPTDDIQLNTPISPVAYLRIIEDVLTMGKALGIAYGFARLDQAMPPLSLGEDSTNRSLFMPQPPASIASSLGLLKSPRVSSASPQRKRQYIDLWPIQIGTATTAVSADGRHAYLTNFDSYVMVLQLGTVLHLVPYWNTHYRLRVMCFVEDQRDVDEEYRRVAKLLRDLRVNAELHVHFMRGAALATYDRAAATAAAADSAVCAAQDESQDQLAPDMANTLPPPPMPLPPNSTQRQESGAASQQQEPDDDPQLTPSGFSMRVNLPMPLRYEATRLEHVSGSLTADRSSGGGGGGGGRSVSITTTSSNELSSDSESSDSDIDGHDASLLDHPPLSARGGMFGSHRIAFGSRNDAALLSGRGGASELEPIPRLTARRNTSVGTDGILWNSLQRTNTMDTQPRLSRVYAGPNSRVIKPRRRSDGSMVLSNIFPHALAAAGSDAPRSTDTSDTTAARNDGTSSGQLHPDTTTTSVGALGLNISRTAPQTPVATEFNDMPIGTQNLILNELIRRESREGSTAVIFTTLQAPEPGTSDSEQKTMEYLRDIDTLAKDLPPVFLVHATSLTVTTSL
ncbi:hypothetical protein GGI22_005193, partial [Coemansia erecta]